MGDCRPFLLQEATIEDATAFDARGIAGDCAADYQPEAGRQNRVRLAGNCGRVVHQAAAILSRGVFKEGAPQDRQVTLVVRSATKPTEGRWILGEQTGRGILAESRVADQGARARGAEEQPASERAEGQSVRCCL